MIHGPDPESMDEYQQIPPEMIKYFRWGEGGEFESDELQKLLRLPQTDRETLWTRLQTFLNGPPTEMQLYLLACERNRDTTEAEILEIMRDICRRLELSLRAPA